MLALRRHRSGVTAPTSPLRRHRSDVTAWLPSRAAQAAALPLQQSVALDIALWAAAAHDKRMADGGGQGRAAMPQELLRVLSEAEASYKASASEREAGEGA